MNEGREEVVERTMTTPSMYVPRVKVSVQYTVINTAMEVFGHFLVKRVRLHAICIGGTRKSES